MLLLLLACGAPTLAEVQDEVFTPSCTFSTCHGASAPSAGLDLTEGAAHAGLVGVASADAPGETRVIAGDPDASYLVKKLLGEAGITGDPMPPGGAALDADKIDLVVRWIEAGAAAE